MPANWRGEAFNPATESANRIHSDEMAQAYGFKGALVPGVTISAYLMHPAVEAWGRDWLDRGHAEVVVHKPLYDQYAFEVVLNDVTTSGYTAILVDQEGTRCASGTFSLPDELPEPPVRRGDGILEKGATAPPVSRPVLEALREQGMGALVARWDGENDQPSYLRDPAAQATLHRPDGDNLAHGGFLLGLTNWVLAANVYMNPWVHVQTESQFFRAVAPGTKLVAECAVVDLFERRGHEFVDVAVNAFDLANDEAVMAATLRAIYRLRPPA